MCFSALFRIERVKVHPVSTSVMFAVRVSSPLRVGPQWARVTGLEEPRLCHGLRPPALRILIELREPTDWPWSSTCPVTARWPAPWRGSGQWLVALTSTRLVSDGWSVAELVVELAARLQQAWQQRHDSLRNLAAATLPWRPTPAGGPSTRRRSSCGLCPWLRRLSTTWWALGCGHHQASAHVVPAPAGDRADFTRGSAPCPSSMPSRTSWRTCL